MNAITWVPRGVFDEPPTWGPKELSEPNCFWVWLKDQRSTTKKYVKMGLYNVFMAAILYFLVNTHMLMQYVSKYVLWVKNL